MNANLTPEQVKLLQQLQKQKIQHRESQNIDQFAPFMSVQTKQ